MERFDPDRLIPAPGVALTVLRMIDDEDCGAADLARAIAADPVLSARTMRLANSSYFGLSGRVSTLQFAVSVLGLRSLRGIAVTVAAGLGGGSPVPEGFWNACAFTATCTEMVAPVVGADAGDGFAVGLLHLIGAALLHQASPLPRLCLPDEAHEDELCEDERARYGIGHDELGAMVLARWQLPGHLVETVAEHRTVPMFSAPSLTRALYAGRVMATGLLTRDLFDEGCGGQRRGDELVRVTEGRWGPADFDDLLARACDRAEALRRALDGS